jgi:predicted dehydrogenase
MNKLRIAVAGAGYIGQAHMGVIQAGTSCALSAIVDPAPAAQDLAHRLQVPCYRDLGELIARDRPDAVVLATPNRLHLDHACQCMDAGLPMLLEKPITPTVKEAQELVQRAADAGAKVLIGHHRAHSPIMARAREVVAQGRLGAIVAVVGTAMFFKPDQYYADGPWRREVGGGPILLNMIHEVHNLRMLCGEIVSVQALASHAVRGFAVEDTVAINLRFASGALGTFLLSDTAASARSWEQTAQENPAYASYGDEDCYVIAGTFGSLAVPTMRLKTYASAEERSWWKPFQEDVVSMMHEDPLARQIAHFVQVARGEAEPIVSARDGLRNLRVTEAIAEAAHIGATIEIPL